MASPITVLGVGNPIMGDDGTGLALLRRLRDGAQFRDDEWIPSVAAHRPAADSAYPSLRFIDGGTAGMELIEDVTQADSLLLLDAMAGPGRPGDVVCLEGDQIPRLIQSQLSPHQVGLLDLLAGARLLGREPRRVAAVGVVVDSVTVRVGLSPVVEASLPAAVDAARGLIARWQDPRE